MTGRRKSIPEIDPASLVGERVSIHYNLQRCRPGTEVGDTACFVVSGKPAGRVIGYVRSIALEDVEPKIYKKELARIRTRQRRKVCCYILGTVVPRTAVKGRLTEVSFNPFEMPCFYKRGTTQCVDSADFATFDGTTMKVAGATTSPASAGKHSLSNPEEGGFWEGGHGKPPQPSPYSILKGVEPVTRQYKGFELFAVQQARTGTWFAKALGYDDDYIGVGPDAQEALARAAMYLDADIPPREKMNPRLRKGDRVRMDPGMLAMARNVYGVTADDATPLVVVAVEEQDEDMVDDAVKVRFPDGKVVEVIAMMLTPIVMNARRAQRKKKTRKTTTAQARAILSRAMRGT